VTARGIEAPVAAKDKFEATYVDSSVWCAYCFNQAESYEALQWLVQTDLSRLGTSWWTETEFASALGIQLRKKALTAVQARHARDRFADLMDVVNRLNVIEPDYLEAAAWVVDSKHGLRGGDALHLAVAQRHGCKAVATLDVNMQQNAKRLGLRVIDFL
jgi:uncharacterized protein